jgi:hypothetical protein
MTAPKTKGFNTMPLPDSARHFERLASLLKEVERSEKKLEDNAFALRDDLRKVLALPILTSDIKGYAEDLLAQVNEHIDGLNAQFGLQLSRACQAKDLPFAGNYPDFRSRLFHIHMDKERGKSLIWYGPQQEKLDVVEHEVNAIIKALEQAPRQISSELDGSTLSDLIRQTFDEYGRKPYNIIHFLPLLTLVISRRNKSFREDPVPEHYYKYGRVRFSYDLYRYRDELSPLITLKTATRMNTNRKEDYLWVPKPDEETGRGTNYGMIIPKEGS